MAASLRTVGARVPPADRTRRPAGGSLKGEAKAKDADERLAFVDLCNKKSLFAASARLWGKAFADRPSLEEDLDKGHRYNAACAAALAGGGSGKDDPPPDDAAREALQAGPQLVEGRPGRLGQGQRERHAGGAEQRRADDAALATGRRPRRPARQGGLAKLPEAEREACCRLWAEVESLLAKATAPPKP